MPSLPASTIVTGAVAAAVVGLFWRAQQSTPAAVPFKEYHATSKAVWLKAPLDEGVPGPEHFEIREDAVTVTPASLADGDIVIKVLAMSVDPYLRGQIKSTNLFTGAKNFEESKASPMRGFIAGKVLASKNPAWTVGDFIGAALPFATVQVVSAKALGMTMAWKLTGHVTESDISLGVGALGMPGATAYGGFIDVLKPNTGETLFVSSAAGAVGSLVGQLAKNVYNCTVVGSCGGPTKNAHIKSKYGFDHAIDYKALKHGDDKGLSDLKSQLTAAVPEGIDMYFENVGGIHFDAAMATLRPHGRVAVCGAISGYNEKEGPKNSLYIGQLIYTFQRIEGFVCMPWLTGAKGNFLGDMSRWIKEGKLKVDETMFSGVGNWAVGFNSLFTDTGRKLGKVVIKMKAGDHGEDRMVR